MGIDLHKIEKPLDQAGMLRHECPLFDLPIITSRCADVAAFMITVGKMQMRQGLKYMIMHPNFRASLMKMSRLLEEENDLWLRSGKMDLKASEGYFPVYESRLYHAKVMRAALEGITRKKLSGFVKRQDVRVEKVEAGTVPAEWITPANAVDGRLVLYIHGGGFMLCSPATHRGMNARLAVLSRTRILSIDYRMAPEHKHPAALDDCLTAYRRLTEQGFDPQHIVLGGDSAGGNLVLATLHRLKQLGEELPRAAGVHVRLEEWDEMIHDFPAFGIAAEWPEVDQALEKMAGFVAEMSGE